MIRWLRHRIFLLLAEHPTVYLPLTRLLIRLNVLQGQTVGRHTELVIEGFPRSGNTFAVAAFIYAQSRPVLIAHHRHAPAQVIRAVRNGVPTLVLIRRPADAVMSRAIRRSLSISIKQSLEDYIRFYSRIKPYRCGYVVGVFDDVTSDFGTMIERINGRFGTSFSKFEHTQSNVRDIFSLIEQGGVERAGRSQASEMAIPRPSSERAKVKAVMEKDLEAEGLGELLARAEALYADFTSHSS